MELEKNKSLKEYTTFRIGGRAKYFFAPKNLDEAKQAYFFAKKNKLKVFVLGKGSNILFDDSGFSGLVIYNNVDFFDISNNVVSVGGGFSFPALGVTLANNNLGGLEFAAGVPGSVGGAVYMNASSYGQAVSDTIQSVDYLEEDGSLVTYTKDQMLLSYRSSIFQKKKGMILSAKFMIQENKNASQKQIEILQKKRLNQPLNEKNAGCVFKNPKNDSARRLIEECGLKNHTIGGAKVSIKHTNFIINENNASSKDVLDLILYIKNIVKFKKNIILKQEVEYISD